MIQSEQAFNIFNSLEQVKFTYHMDEERGISPFVLWEVPLLQKRSTNFLQKSVPPPPHSHGSHKLGLSQFTQLGDLNQSRVYMAHGWSKAMDHMWAVLCHANLGHPIKSLMSIRRTVQLDHSAICTLEYSAQRVFPTILSPMYTKLILQPLIKRRVDLRTYLLLLLSFLFLFEVAAPLGVNIPWSFSLICKNITDRTAEENIRQGLFREHNVSLFYQATLSGSITFSTRHFCNQWSGG